MYGIFKQEEIRQRCKNPKFCIACFRAEDNVNVDESHVCEPCRNGSMDSAKTPRRLPVVTMENGKSYFVDSRLRQLRNVHNPHDFIDCLGPGRHDKKLNE